MIEKICHIGPALDVQGGISSVLASYKKLFNLPNENFLASYTGSFVRSLPVLLRVCFKLLFKPNRNFAIYQIHTSSYGSFFRKYLISRCLRIRGLPYIPHVHGSMFDKFCLKSPFFVKWAIKDYFRHAKRIIVLSSEMEEFLKSFDSSFSQFVTVPNPGENIAEHPVNLSLHKEPVRIVFSGRFGKRKGVYDLLKAFDEAVFLPPTELYLYGDGEVEKVLSLVERAKKRNKIHVSSWLKHDEYLEQLQTFDFLVLPSYAERFSMSLVEALGMGLPVVSTFVGGTAEVVENGVCGVLCQPGDINCLTVALETLANNRELRSQMGLAGWNRARTNFSAEVVLDKLERCYCKLFAELP
jgi:glycosyltransferase involved in cell wall biosynthesis